MDNSNHEANTHYKVVRRTINGCPVSVWADTQKQPATDPAVLRHLLAAYEDRLKQEQAEQ